MCSLSLKTTQNYSKETQYTCSTVVLLKGLNAASGKDGVARTATGRCTWPCTPLTTPDEPSSLKTVNIQYTFTSLKRTLSLSLKIKKI